MRRSQRQPPSAARPPRPIRRQRQLPRRHRQSGGNDRDLQPQCRGRVRQRKLYNKVVSDGDFWINGSTFVNYGAGAAVPVNVANEAGGIGDDWALHFVSSCIGSPGGGLTIPSRAGTYGEPGAARLDELLVGNSLGGYGTTYQVGVLVSSVSQLHARRCHRLRLGRQRWRKHERH